MYFLLELVLRYIIVNKEVVKRYERGAKTARRIMTGA